jgi:PIN domain nuclease of toxin-antitoxin system
LSPHHLTARQRKTLEHTREIGVSVISCWEVAKAFQLGRLELPVDAETWLADACRFPGVLLIPLSLPIILESTRLPQPFHRDPADEMLVATARVQQCPLVTCDAKIRAYSHVETIY